jgi:predicted RNA polymerase sigma factor
MLQTVLGVDAERIAAAFLVSPAAMSQRLVRAKNRIRDAAIPFGVPDPPEWDERIFFVLDAIYSAYTTGWESLIEPSSTHHALAGDAIAAAGLAALEEIPTSRVVSYQPYWAARGHLLTCLNQKDEAQKSFRRAASLTDDPALREYLIRCDTCSRW